MNNKTKSTRRNLVLIILLIASSISLIIGLYLWHWISERTVTADRSAPLIEANTNAVNSNENVQNKDLLIGSAVSSSSPELKTVITQRVNNIEITTSNYRVEQDRILIDICFEFPNEADWTIWNASLKSGNTIYEFSGGNPIEVREPPVNGKQKVITWIEGGGINTSWVNAADGSMGLRCETVYFNGVLLDTTPTHFTFTVDAIEAAPREGEECTKAYLEKWQAALDARNTGIKVKCIESGYVSGLEVADKPISMTTDEATTILSSIDLYLDVNGIRGPWVFELDIK